MAEPPNRQWTRPGEPLPHGRLGRYRQVLEILARHGFGWLLGQLGLSRRVPSFPWGPLGHRPPPAPTQAEHLRLALEELGVTFIKLGQILSTRSDLLPPEYVAELQKLQDAVPAEPIEVVQTQIERELGSPPSRIFARFDPEPIGSASIGQVHSAQLQSGEEVVVKVQRPGVEALVEEDLAILRDLSRAAGRTFWGRIYDLPALVDEFASILRRELDYLVEGQNAERFRHDFLGDPRVRIPRIHWDYTTRRVLTMERLEGIKISDLQALEKAGVDRRRLAAEAAQLTLEMILEHGFFHADPHPGNFVVMEGDVIGLLDFGIVGHLDEATRDGLLFLLLAIANQDMDRVVDQLLALGVTGSSLQLDRLRNDLSHLLSLYWGMPLKEIEVGRVIEEALAIVRRHRLQLPTNLVLLTKTMAMDEGLARNLDPEFSAAEVLRPYVLRLVRRRYLPQHWARRLLPTLLDLSQMTVTLPRRTERLLTRLERGNISVNMRVQETDYVLEVLNSVASRLVLGMLASGFAVAIALLIQTYYAVGFHWLVVGWLLALGMAFVAVLGLWLVLTILRRGQH